MVKIEDIVFEQCEITILSSQIIESYVLTESESTAVDRIKYILSRIAKTIVKLGAWLVDKFRLLFRFIGGKIMGVIKKIQGKPNPKILGWVDCKLAGLVELSDYAEIAKKIYDSVVNRHPISKDSPFYKKIEELRSKPGGVKVYITELTLSKPKDTTYATIQPTIYNSEKIAGIVERKQKELLSKVEFIKKADKVLSVISKFGIDRLIDKLFYMANTIISGITAASNALGHYMHQCARVISAIKTNPKIDSIDLRKKAT